MWHHILGLEIEDITPNADGLDAAQEKIALFLANFLAATLDKEQLLKVFNPDDPFSMDWDAFYRAIDKALVADGFERYKDWAVRIAEDPDIVKSPLPKKRQASEELESLPDWFRSATATKPATKKPKKENDEKDPGFP